MRKRNRRSKLRSLSRYGEVETSERMDQGQRSMYADRELSEPDWKPLFVMLNTVQEHLEWASTLKKGNVEVLKGC